MTSSPPESSTSDDVILVKVVEEEWVEIPVPDVSHLVTEDDTPVDNLLSEKQQRLLINSLYSSLLREEPFLAAANVGLYYAVKQPAIVPDVLLSLGVSVPEDWSQKQNRASAAQQALIQLKACLAFLRPCQSQCKARQSARCNQSRCSHFKGTCSGWAAPCLLCLTALRHVSPDCCMQQVCCTLPAACRCPA